MPHGGGTAPVGTAIVFVHGAGPQGPDTGSGGLLAWLRDALDEERPLSAPAMPAPEKPSCAAWCDRIAATLAERDEPVALVGHSLGGSVLLQMLCGGEIAREVAGLHLVAAPYWGMAGWEVPEFTLPDGFADTLPPGLAVFLYHARDDAVVPVVHQRRYARALPGAAVRTIDAGGHEFRSGLPPLADDLRLTAEQKQKRS